MDVFLILFACLVSPFVPATDSPAPVGIAQSPTQRVDVYDSKSNRVAWGLRSADGRTDFFKMDGTRIGWSSTTNR